MMWGDEETERRWRAAVEKEKRDAEAKKEARWTPAYGSGGGKQGPCILWLSIVAALAPIVGGWRWR